jgi:hypothetical protein
LMLRKYDEEARKLKLRFDAEQCHTSHALLT